MEFTPTELITLAILLAGAPFLAVVVRTSPLPAKRGFVLAYALLLLSNVFTIVEGVALPRLFNALEHGATALFAVSLLVSVRVFLVSLSKGDRGGTRG